MACSSTSSDHKKFIYDVFISFRGEDTRKNFVDHLYFALQQKNIRTYMDSERIKKGKKIKDELMKSIEESKFYIVVFSKNYASSSWCMNELAKIMECHKTTQHGVYPIFFDVEPYEVRKLSGVVGKAFAKHTNEKSACKWREAVKEVADLAGYELKNTFDGHEARFIQKIVDDISIDLCNSNVGLRSLDIETLKKGAMSSLKLGCDIVCMIAIMEMGGGVKASLARVAYDQISSQFEGELFVKNVKVVSKASMLGLKLLQSKFVQKR